MSMKPGARTRPLPSMTFSSGRGLRLEAMAVMRSPEMRTLSLRSGAPVPSAIFAWMMRMEDVELEPAVFPCATERVEKMRNAIRATNVGTNRLTRIAVLLRCCGLFSISFDEFISCFGVWFQSFLDERFGASLPSENKIEPFGANS